MVFGVIADRAGRTLALMASIVIYSVFTAACGFAQTVGQLAVFRVLLGLGMGGEWASGAALVSETWSAEHRGKALGFMQSSWAIGYGAAAIVTWLVLPRFGWRAVFFVGVLPALFTFWIQRRVEEPAIWREARAAKEPSGGFAAIFGPGIAGLTVAVTVMNACTMFAWWGFNLWLPGYLSLPRDQGGVGLSTAVMSGFVVAMQVGMWFGYVTFGFISDALGRKRTYVVYLLTASVLIWIYASVRTPVVLLLPRAVRGVFCHRLLLRLRRRHGRDLSDGHPRHRAGLHLQHRPGRERRRPLRGRVARRRRAASAWRSRSARRPSCSRRSRGSGFRRPGAGRSRKGPSYGGSPAGFRMRPPNLQPASGPGRAEEGPTGRASRRDILDGTSTANAAGVQEPPAVDRGPSRAGKAFADGGFHGPDGRPDRLDTRR